VVQALIDNLIARGLDPAVPRLFIIDGSKALSKAIRRSFGREAMIQRCQIHKARNIMERLPKHPTLLFDAPNLQDLDLRQSAEGA
jgi:putative transposase